MRLKQNKGFTLIEFIVIMAILGIVAVAMLGNNDFSSNYEEFNRIKAECVQESKDSGEYYNESTFGQLRINEQCKDIAEDLTGWDA